MKGFTLIEILLVVALVLILVAVGSPIYGNLLASSQLNDQTANIVQTLRTARQRSLAGMNNAVHGVYLQTDSYTLYQDFSPPYSYATRDLDYDRVINLDDSLTLSATLNNNDINFSSLGEPNDSNTGIISLTHAVSDSRSIVINQIGLIESD